MKTGCLVQLLICAMCFNLVFAWTCSENRDKCLRACEKGPNFGVCKKRMKKEKEKHKKRGERKKRRNKKRGKQWSNQKRALISLGLEAIQAAHRRLTANPKIIRMGTN
ncbi:hypothetical protein ScPMuIL_013324 [Solemya velum]